MSARYDGHSDWYDQAFSGHAMAEEHAFLRRCLGYGGGEPCLDVACGTGLHARAVTEAGYRALGFDISGDQLRLARRRLAAAVRADARFLPVRDAAVPAAVGMFFHTDVEDFAAVVREVARCLRPEGRFVYCGLHPCFIGPFVNRTAEDEDRQLTFAGGYGRVGWASRGSGDGTGVWSRVGGHHKTLASFLGAVTGSGLVIRELAEFSGGGTILPRNIGLLASRT